MRSYLETLPPPLPPSIASTQLHQPSPDTHAVRSSPCMRVQADAASLYAYFAAAGYSIMYKDVVNTVFLHKSVRCVGGD